MSLQDRSIVRTAADLEKKYNLSKLVGLTKNIETNNQTLIKMENELNDFVITTTSSLENMETEIDGKVATWYYSGQPSLSTSPANEWTTDEERSKHIGDLYYDKSTGYCYRFQYSSNTYSWEILKDNDITEAMAIANAAKDTADGKRRIFVATPTTPYDNGDLWVQGENGEIMVCQLARAEGDYSEGDWVVASKYTDDTVANAIVDEMGGTTTTVLGGTVTQYSKNWVKFTDLSTGGSTTIAGENIKTGTIDASKVKIANNNVVIDSDGIKLNNGAKVVGSNGLMNTYLYEKEGIVGYSRDFTLNEATGEYDHIATGGLTLNFVVPKGLAITEAKVQIIHTPIRWLDEEDNYLSWGKCNNIKIYKGTNLYSRVISAPLNAGILYNADTTTYNEISGALGTSGWTPSKTPSDTSYDAETKESTDIKSSLVEGLNRIKISVPDATQTWTNANMAARSGYLYVALKINGYMTYE